MSTKDEQRWPIGSNRPSCIWFTDEAHFWLGGYVNPIMRGVTLSIAFMERREAKTTGEQERAILTEIGCMPLEIISSIFSQLQIQV